MFFILFNYFYFYSVSVPFLIAAKKGHVNCMKLLFKYKVNIEQKDGSGRTALHLASWFGNKLVADFLLEIKSNIDVTDTAGHTPLHLACWFGHFEVAQLLINKGANLDAIDNGGQTPLHFACQHNHPKIVKLLIESGANTKLQTKNGRTAEQLAIQDSEIIEIFQNSLKFKNDSQNNLPSQEQDIILECNKAKNSILKLNEANDIQSEQISQINSRLDHQNQQIINLQKDQEELKLSLDSLHTLLNSLFLDISQYCNYQHFNNSNSNILNKNLCKSCKKNPPVVKCKHCKTPFCNSCADEFEIIGCPFCHK